MQTAIERGWTVRKIKANKTDLLAAIKANYEAHKKAYADAFDGWKVEVQEQLDKARKAFAKAAKELEERAAAADRDKGDKPVPLYLPPTLIGFAKKPPQDHSKDYEAVIRMLEFETGDTFEVEQGEFEAYVMDRWDWKDDFQNTVVGYAGKAALLRRAE